MNKRTLRTLREYSITVILAVGIAFLIRMFVIEAYQIPSFSMKPTLLPGDTLFVAKWPSWLQKDLFPTRGDIVVFSGVEEGGKTPVDFIKRVIGLPGDRIQMTHGHLFLNGQNLSLPKQGSQGQSQPCGEEKLPTGSQYLTCKEEPYLEDFGPIEVPPFSLLVMGDYRSQRYEKKKRKAWDLISKSQVKGKALWIWLSLDPKPSSHSARGWIPPLRFDRMFRRIQ